ncbi:MAG: hypothetical protein NPIRA04_05070 [Nitrospirales bacterium]|nr:MAG: hypothetical protein NPIRA04_05070 [Nitrospirales bacterium]
MAWIRRDIKAQGMNRASCWFWLLLVALLFSACGKSAPSQKPVEVQDLQVRSQERIVHAAKSDVLSARYAQAIEKLNRFLSTYPSSSFESEVRWLLARSYHKSGKVKTALKHYQQVLDQGEGSVHYQEAQQYKDQIQASLTPPDPPLTAPATRPPSIPRIRQPAEVFALQMTLGQWVEGRNWKTRLKNMSRRGVTTQLINLECGMLKEDAGALFRSSSSLGTDSSGLSQSFSSFVMHAHQHGLSVFLGVNVRCLGRLLDGDSGSRWADRAYDHQTKGLRSTQYFDLFNREYQIFLKDILAVLASTGIDGIVFLDDAPMGMFDGVTPIALKKFQQEFGLKFHPQKVFAIKSLNGKMGRVVPPKESEFWRWIGWRSRAQLKVLRDLMDSIRQSHSKVQVALELYAGGLNEPLRTLLQLNEDILESNNLDFSFLVVDVDGPQRIEGSSGGLPGRFQQESLSKVAKRFLEIFKDPTRLWLTVPKKLGMKAWSSESLKELTGEADVPQGIGLVYDLRPFS